MSRQVEFETRSQAQTWLKARDRKAFGGLAAVGLRLQATETVCRIFVFPDGSSLTYTEHPNGDYEWCADAVESGIKPATDLS